MVTQSPVPRKMIKYTETLQDWLKAFVFSHVKEMEKKQLLSKKENVSLDRKIWLLRINSMSIMEISQKSCFLSKLETTQIVQNGQAWVFQ